MRKNTRISKTKKETLTERVEQISQEQEHMKKTLGLMAHALEGMGKFMENTNIAVVGLTNLVSQIAESKAVDKGPSYIK